MHKKIVDEVKDNLRDVILRPKSYNKKYPSTRFDSYFIGVEDTIVFSDITIATETKYNKEMTILRVDKNYDVILENYKHKKK